MSLFEKNALKNSVIRKQQPTLLQATFFERYKLAIIFIAILTIALMTYWIKKPTATASKAYSTETTQTNTKAPNAALAVNTVNISRINMSATVPANGNIAPWQEAVVGAEVNGLLLNEVLVNVGDNVKRGQVLARFATGTIAADLAQATANYAEAKAAAIEAASNASRAKSIQNTGALSTQQIEQYLSLEASTKARLEAAEATLNLQKIKLQQTTVIAPDSGVISARTATVGAVAAAGQELFKLVRQGRLEWRAELTSADVNSIKIGMKADLTLPDGHILTGKVRAIAPSIDSATRNALVYVDIPSAAAKAGMYAKGVFNLGSTVANTLPADAIVLRDGFSYAMQVVPLEKTQTNNKLARIKQIKIETGRRSGNVVELSNGEALLNAAFVASGGAFLADGDTVKVVGNIAQQNELPAPKVEIGKFTDYKATSSASTTNKTL